MIITIDGPSGAGKSSVAKSIADKINFEFLDTGAMYRCAALIAKRNSIDLNNQSKLVELLAKSKIDFNKSPSGITKVLLDNKDVSDLIRTPDISISASEIAKIRQVREVLVEKQKEFAKRRNIVVEGRDMGTYVFPNAEYKFYLDASPRIRAKRRWDEFREKGMEISFDSIETELKERDSNDMDRKDSPLHPADNAVIIDTTDLNLGEVVNKVLKILEES
ncbi:MAG: (d)CMP kinase [Thermodesulfobacteriota bacterium]